MISWRFLQKKKHIFGFKFSIDQKDEKMSEDEYMNETEAVRFLRSVAKNTATVKGNVCSLISTVNSLPTKK